MMTHEFRFFFSFRRFQTVQPWNLDRFISSSDNSMIGLNFCMPIANPVIQNIEQLQDSQSRRSTESARTRSSFTRTYIIASEIFDDISRQLGIFDQQFQTLENKMKDFLDSLGKKVKNCNSKVDTYQNDYYEWAEQVERSKSTGVSHSAYYTCNTRDSDTTGDGDIAGTRPPTNSEQRTIQTRTNSPFSKVATTFTTSKKTKTFFSSTTPKRRCWWIDKRFRKLLKNRQRASNRVFLVTSSNIRCFSFFRSCPQPFHTMIRIPFDRDRISHGHL